MNSDYFTECTQLLQAFELTQAGMLQKKHQLAGEEFQIEILKMRQIFIHQKDELQKKNTAQLNKQLILIKQIERLISFMKEFALHMEKLCTVNDLAEEEIIFIFERQYKFKAIYKKHLADFRTAVAGQE